MDEVCRFCTTTSDTLEHIFAERVHSDNEPLLIYMLKSCTDCEIEPSDALPQNICANCKSAVKSAYQFKQKCEQSQKYFKDLLCLNDHKPEIAELTTGIWCVTESAIGEVHSKSEISIAHFKTDLEDSDDRIESNAEAESSEVNKFKPTRQSRRAANRDNFRHNCCEKISSNHINRSICCAVCLKWFSSQRSYRIHVRMHAEELPHQCTSCPLRFQTLLQLRKHLLTHIGERLHKCPDCPKAFTHPSLLKKHSYTHMKERPFQCPHCPKSFKRNNDLSKHNIVHTGEKPYQCSECLKSFGRIYDLKVHADHLHPAKVVYKCSKCAETFVKSRILSRHVKFCMETQKQNLKQNKA